jgi:hypothetical protein
VEILDEFVSTIWPMRISSPIVQIVAVTILNYSFLAKYLFISLTKPGPL